ncbi:MAG: EAL domain-containing protein [Rhodoferax sp.]
MAIHPDSVQPTPPPSTHATDRAVFDSDDASFFGVVFNQSPEAIAVTRVRDDVIVAVNDEWLKYTGYERHEVVGHTAVEIGHWADTAAREQAFYPLKMGGRLTDVDVTVFLKDNMPRMVRINATRVSVQGEAYILVYARDVTAEKLAREALQAGEKALEQANERLNRQVKLYEMTETVARVGHWVVYPGDPTVHLSHGYSQVGGLGETQSAPVGAHLRRVVKEDRDKVKQALKRMTGEVVEYRWQQPDGHTIWLRSRMQRQIENGVVKADLGVVQEFTAEREALQAVSNQLAFVQKITSRAPSMLYEFQWWPDGRFSFPFVSAAVQSLFGLTEAEVRADPRRLLHRILAEDLPHIVQTGRESMDTLAIWQCEFRARDAGDAVRWLLGNSQPERQADGSVLWCGSIGDITAQKEVVARLQDSEARFRSLTELSSDWYWEQDENYRFIRVQGSMDVARTLRADQVIGTTRWGDDVVGVSPEQWAAHRAALDARETFRDFEMQRRGQDGLLVWVSISGTPVFDADGVCRGYRGTGRDITARKQAEADIERLAFFDALTGLPNRRLLIDRLNHAVESGTRRGSYGALLFIDLDNFKMLNDTVGHHMGDELLKQVAARLGACVRSIDTVARLGGDEFVVMLEELSENALEAGAQAEAVGKKILEALNRHFELGGQQHHSSPSIGVTLFFDHQQSVDELLKRADLAMYQAKAAGRNTLRFFDPAMQAAASLRAELETDLRQGLLRNEFRLYYQPVVDERSRVTGVEALLRWQHPRRGLVAPGEFIPVAEQSGLILPLGEWVLKEACAQLVAWSTQPATRNLSMAVNVSARQFRHPEFSSQILTLLRLSGANPYRLKLELTESLLLSDFDDAIVKMSELRSIGVGFSLDDFGTGYSSLSYLKRLPLDQLKIDQSFVRDVLTDPNDAAIARTILNLAQSLDLGAVAEGVETAGQRDFLLRNGCKAFQGFFFGRPVPIEQLRLDGAL